MTTIPVQNIYYLLCYAWDKLEEADIVKVGVEGSTDLLELFTRVLINGSNHLLKKGLDRNYITEQQEVAGIRGKLELAGTLKHNKLVYGRTVCTVDEFSRDILHNQILKATVGRLLKLRGFDKALKDELHALDTHLWGIAPLRLKPAHFSSVRLHRNNYFYDFLLKVCRIIYDNLLINEESGAYVFSDFLRDEAKMARVFEQFLRRFYEKHAGGYTVDSDIIDWQWRALTKGAEAYLPQMRTDLTLRRPGQKIILDAKYYRDALSTFFDTRKLHAANLYQLHAYLSNQERATEPDTMSCAGILVYPTTTEALSLHYRYREHRVHVETVNLQGHWQEIHQQLLQIITIPAAT